MYQVKSLSNFQVKPDDVVITIMNDTLYQALRLLGAPFAFRCVGLENIRDSGPAIYVANHLSSIGPIEAILSVPVRFYPWVIAEMMDVARAPQYLYDDFVHPAWNLEGRGGLLVATIMSRLTVGLMHGLGCVSVDRNRGRNLSAFRHSLALLNQGKNLLVFPEDPKGPLDPETRMRPFLCGFISLCSMYARATGRPLPMYPLVVSSQAKTISIDAPLFFEPHDNHRHNIRAVCARLREKMEALYQASEVLK